MDRRIEKRIGSPVTFRNQEEGEEKASRALQGHAAIFDTPANIAGLFDEIIKPGAFKRALEEKQEVFALVNHDPGKILGNSRSGTLSMREDKTGLAVDVDLPETSTGEEARVLVERGDLSKMSFGFIATEEKWTERKDQPPLREVLDADLFDVSVVAFPAYDGTDVAVRNADETLKRYLESREGHRPEPQLEPEESGHSSILARFRLKVLQLIKH